MTSKKLLVFFLLGGLSACSTLPVQVSRNYDFSKIKRVAVLGFEPYASDDISGKTMVSVFEKMLIEQGYQVVERSQVDKILGEQNFQFGGAVDPTQVVQLGKILGVDALVMGSVTVYRPHEISYQTVQIDAEYEDPIITRKTIESVKDGKKIVENIDVVSGYVRRKETQYQPQLFRVQAEVGVFVKMVDATSGELVWVGSTTEQGTNIQVASEYLGRTIFNALKKDKKLALKK